MFELLGIDPAWLAKATFELNLLLLFTICLAHSLKVHGPSRTLREFVAGFTLTALAESTGVLSGAYVYPGFYLYIWATPVGNPASWVALVYIIMTLSNRLLFGPKALLSPHQSPTQSSPPGLIAGSLGLTLIALALCDATLALLLDLVLDPLATVYNWWIWVPYEAGVHTVEAGMVDPYNFSRAVWMTTPDSWIGQFFSQFFEEGLRYPTRILGIPLINFVAWVVFVFSFCLQFRWVESRRHWSEIKRTAVLWSLVLVDWPFMSLLLIAPNL